MSTERSKDGYQKLLYDFIKEVYVICPACNKQAIVKSNGYPNRDKNDEDIKLICTSCGHNKRLSETPESIILKSSTKITTGRFLRIGGSIDPYFHLPLWLTTPCCDDILWAYNYQHLDFLKTHIEAKHRERNIEEISNKSIGSRLPKWMISKKNRDAVLKSITNLYNKK